jgi:hypothetical protein
MVSEIQESRDDEQVKPAVTIKLRQEQNPEVFHVL